VTPLKLLCLCVQKIGIHPQIVNPSAAKEPPSWSRRKSLRVRNRDEIYFFTFDKPDSGIASEDGTGFPPSKFLGDNNREVQSLKGSPWKKFLGGEDRAESGQSKIRENRAIYKQRTDESQKRLDLWV
jgi:hypothetical protein